MDKTRLVQITRRNKIAEEEFNPLINYIYEQIWQRIFPPQILTDDLATKTANNLITPADVPIPDCVTCGACCAALPCVGVRSNENIAAEQYWDVTIAGESGEITVDRFLRRDSETFACVNLDGAIGERVGCRIYEQRPQMCRDFEAGSDKCRALRRAYGFEPFLSLQEMFLAVQKLKAQPPKIISDEAIIKVNFCEQAETGNLEITVLLKNGSACSLHVFDPQIEAWRRFEFDGMTFAEAKDLINSRRENLKNEVVPR